MREKLTILFLFCFLTINAQYAPKEEFRGVWIASVANIDYPQAPTSNGEFLKEEWLFLLDELKALNFNALVVQIRPAGDALYPTELAPWSAYLTGKQGLAPEPYFDPLEFMVRTAHERNMEFHAWLNPYRATMNLKTELLDPGHQLFKNPQWFEKYGGKYYYNPALPEVQQHVTDVVEEIVTKYDVDAIHFDDYFYPYKSGDQEFPDYTEYQKYGSSFPNQAAFREYSVTRMIDMVASKIKEIKPYVQFGISPFGVWRNGIDDVRGSDSRAGVRAYDDLHAHILKWLREGTIDYVAPQLYWSIGYSPADYEKLLNWWTDWNFGKNLYIGHAIYKIDNNADPAWADATEIPRQIFLNRDTKPVDGSIHFSASKLRLNPLDIIQSLKVLYESDTKLPEMVWLDVAPAVAPHILKPVGDKKNVYLSWEKYADVAEDPYYYHIYRFEGKETGDFSDPRNIIHITPFGKKVERYIDENVFKGDVYTYAVVAINRAHSASNPSLKASILKKKKKVKVYK